MLHAIIICWAVHAWEGTLSGPMAEYNCQYSASCCLLGFLQWNLHNCPLEIRSNCYKAMVKPILDYAAIIWSPHTHTKGYQYDRKKSARFVMNNFSHYASVTHMLINLNWLTLAECREEQKAIMVFKIINHLIDISANAYLTPVPMLHDTRGHIARDLYNQWQELILIYIPRPSFPPLSNSGILYPNTWLTLRTLINLSKD